MLLDSTKPSLQISPILVREIASTIPGCKEIISKSPFILSFLVTPTLSNDDFEEPARIQVYCMSGTVGICRVLNEEVRESFHQRCNLRTVEKLLRHPTELTKIDPEVIFHSNDNSSIDQEASPYGPTETLSEKELAMRDTETLNIAISILAAEEQSIVAHLTSLRRTLKDERTSRRKFENIRTKQNLDKKIPFGTTANFRKRKTNTNTKNVKTKNNKKQEITYSLPANNIEEVRSGLKHAKKGDVLRCIATNGPQSAFLYKSGKWAATGYALKEKLKKHKKVKYISLGTHGRYFMSLKGGKIIWDGPDSMKKYLHKKLDIKCVAFGRSRDTFFVVYKDGSCKYEGLEIPSELKILLRDRKKLNDISCVTTGPSGEWFLRIESGDFWWGGVSKKTKHLFDTLTTGENRKLPHFVDFGLDGSYIMTCE